MRTGTVERSTNETRIKLALDLDGSGRADVSTGIGFLDHMLTLFAGHGLLILPSRLRATCRWMTTTQPRTS